MYMEKIGENIRRVRMLFGYKQQTMADLLKISIYYYGLIERDKVNLSVQRLQQIAKIFDINVLYLMNFKSLIELIQNKNITITIDTEATLS